jgi:hypothetical protein
MSDSVANWESVIQKTVRSTEGNLTEEQIISFNNFLESNGYTSTK